MASAIDLLGRMLAMWNLRDLSKVRGEIDAIFTEDVLFIDPLNWVVGHDAFEEMVRGFRAEFPEAVLTRASGIDGHHGLHRYHWEIHQAGELVIAGFDVAEINEAGRVCRVEGFFGPMPALES